MGNCCTGSPTTDHPFTPEHSLPPPHAGFGNSSPQLGVANTAEERQQQQRASAVVAMAPYPTAGGAGSGGVGVTIETVDSTVVRSPDTVIHMADREGTQMCRWWV